MVTMPLLEQRVSRTHPAVSKRKVKMLRLGIAVAGDLLRDSVRTCLQVVVSVKCEQVLRPNLSNRREMQAVLWYVLGKRLHIWYTLSQKCKLFAWPGVKRGISLLQ